MPLTEKEIYRCSRPDRTGFAQELQVNVTNVNAVLVDS